MKKPSRKQKRKIIYKKIFFLILSIFFVFLLYSLCKSFKGAVWKGKDQLNFVIQTEDIKILSFHPREEILNILTIPAEAHIPVVQGLGEYQISKIYQLGEMEKIGGGKLLSLSLQKFLAVPIDGFIIQPPTSRRLKISEASLDQGKLFSLSLCLLKRECKTNFTSKDLLSIILKFNQLKAGEIRVVNFDQAGVIEEKKLPDDSVILQPDYFRIDSLSQELFGDKDFLEEKITMSIFNGTSQAGLANNSARLVKNLGGRVVNTGNTPEEVKGSVIYFQNERAKDSYTLKRLKRTFPVIEVKKNEQMDEELRFVLGENMQSFF